MTTPLLQRSLSMPRTPRRSFPHVHSLYLSTEQDRQLREYADREGLTASEVMRDALAAYLGTTSIRRDVVADPPVEITRMVIAQSARQRRLARRPRQAPVLPGEMISADATIWRPPPGLRPPSMKQPYPRRDYPMSVDRDGNPVEPPANAVGWRVLMRRHADGPLAECRMHGAPLVLNLRVKHHEFVYAVHHQHAAFYLQPIDELGCVLRFSEIRVPLGNATEWEE